jgi:hypothetical protein
MTDLYTQGIQYGSSLGSLGCSRGRIVNLHSLHDSNRLKAVNRALTTALPTNELILKASAGVVMI